MTRRLVSPFAIVFFVVLSVLASSANAKKPKRLDLFVGEQKVIPAAKVDKWSLGTSGVIDFRLPEGGDEFIMVGLAAGTTSLLLIMTDGSVKRYDIVVRQVRVTERDNIRLDFYFVELSRDSGYRVGIGWPGTIGGTAGMTIDSNLRGTTSTAATLATEVLPRLDLAQDSGWARVLREASLIMANGEAGSFESAGELNFRIESAVATSIQQIIFGSRIDVQPKYDRTTGRLDIKIKATVSELTNIGSDGLPGRSYTNLDTLVNLKLGQSVVLAGIHGKSSGRASEGLPLLSQIPVLGALFGSKTFRETEVENLIFIVPTVVQAVKANKRIEIDDALEAFRKYSGGVDGTFLDRKMRPRSKATSKDK